MLQKFRQIKCCNTRNYFIRFGWDLSSGNIRVVCILHNIQNTCGIKSDKIIAYPKHHKSNARKNREAERENACMPFGPVLERVFHFSVFLLLLLLSPRSRLYSGTSMSLIAV